MSFYFNTWEIDVVIHFPDDDIAADVFHYESNIRKDVESILFQNSFLWHTLKDAGLFFTVTLTDPKGHVQILED